MSRLKAASALFAIITSVNIFPCDPQGNSGIFQDNDLYIPVSKGRSGSGLTKNQFMETIDSIMEVYRPIIEGMGKELVVDRRWDDGTVNASATQLGNTWSVKLYGGLARHHEINQEGFATVVCHEIGHHLGGSPLKTPKWINLSNEGQADYWATLKCLRQVWKGDDNIEIIKSKDIDPDASRLCQTYHTTPEDQALCQRISIGAKSLGRVSSSILKEITPPEFHTPSQKIQRRKTEMGHPKPQCRMDTYIQGALCDKDADEDVTNTDPNVGTCSRKEGYSVGVRPLCWYVPDEMSDMAFILN